MIVVQELVGDVQEADRTQKPDGLTGGNLEEEDKEETGWSQGGYDQGQDVMRLCSRVRNQVVRKPDSPEPPSSRNQGPDIVQGPGNAVVFTSLFGAHKILEAESTCALTNMYGPPQTLGLFI